MKKILVVEGDPAITASIVSALTTGGYQVQLAPDGREGLRQIAADDFDLVVLDVRGPGLECWQLTAGIRILHPVPIVIVSDLKAVVDRVRGLRLGADDYLVKPFVMEELLARVESVLRRGPIRFYATDGGLLLDPVRHSAIRLGQRIKLSNLQAALLAYLMVRAGEVCLRTELMALFWPKYTQGLSGRLDVAIRRLRAKVDDPFRQKLIRAVRGLGYVLDANHRGDWL